MKPGRAGLNGLAIFTILFLLGFGFIVYAVPGSALVPAASSASATTSYGPAAHVYFSLVQVTPASTPGGNATGYAGISVSGESLSVGWFVKGAVPGEQLQMVMQANGSGGATKSFSLTTVKVSSLGTAESQDAVDLAYGYYSIGLVVVDPTTSARSAVLTSVPASAQVAIQSSETTQSSTAIGNSLSFALVSLPVYLHQTVPANYSFREGGALIVALGNHLQITTSFLAQANTAFYTVVETTHQNLTAGKVTTSSTGGGVFKGNVTLSPGTYQIGLLIYVDGKTASPVAVSIPRAIQITLPVTSQTSTSATSTATKTSSSSSEASRTSSTTTSASTSHPIEAVTRLGFTNITVAGAPQGYVYGRGIGGYAVTGGNIYFSLAFTGQNPSTHYSLLLIVNGSARTIGDYTTSANGGGNVGASAALGSGRFVLSLTVLDASSFSKPTAVLASDPSTFTVSTHVITTTTASTHTTTSRSTEPGGPTGHSWVFNLTQAAVTSAPAGYRFATSGKAVVTLTSPFSLLNVELGFDDANPSTTYNAVLVLNGTAVDVGTMTTNRDGEADLHGSVQVNPGRYLLGVMVYDVSDVAAFKAASPVLVLVSDPNTQLAIIVPPSEGRGSASSSASGRSESSTTQGSFSSTVAKAATTINAGAEVETQIQDAVNSLTIPVTVQVTPLSSSTSVRDSRFSLSVGQQVGNGLVIGISGVNVTGPRVLLINMSKTSPLALYPALNVTLDGVPVVEASSALQVLSPSPTDPARYVLIATATSIQLLVSIPHFSVHLIQVAGIVVNNIVNTLALDAPILAGSLLVITLAFAGAYAARKRFFSIL
jgi:hypothetical protein